jgi:hypothetical protein
MTFNTVGVPGSKTQENLRPDITCFKCGKNGHFSHLCLETKHDNGTVLNTVADQESNTDQPSDANGATEEVALAHVGSEEHYINEFNFINTGTVLKSNYGKLLEQHKAPATGCAVPKSWILLDNQSTVDVFCSKWLLKNIRELPDVCRISCNAGVVIVKMIGDLPGYPAPIWYHPDGIANILSLFRVTEHCRVQYDSNEERAAFHVTKSDGNVRDFWPSASGLRYCDARENETVLVNTVAAKRDAYTVRAYKQAVLAQRIQDVIGRPSTRDYVKIVEGGMLSNCPITRADIVAAEDIFGLNLGPLKGKTVRRKNTHVPSLVSDVPYDIIKTHRDVTLCFDIMFVNKVAFLVTVSRKIRFGTTEIIMSRHAGVVIKATRRRVIGFYQKRGFRVKRCLCDHEFECLRADLADTQTELDVTAAEDEHVPEAERYTRTIKERTRAVYNTVAFKKMPGMMIGEMVHASSATGSTCSLRTTECPQCRVRGGL